MAAGACAWHRTSITYRSERCLAVWAPHIACEACLSVCPRDSLRLGDRRVTADQRCVGCGRCAVVCPTGAIEASGYRPDIRDDDTAEAISVECRRVAVAALPATAVRVPCLGGLAPDDLLELRLAAGTRPIHLIDRGWCASCPAGGTPHPARTALQRVAVLFEEMGRPDLAPTLVIRTSGGRRDPARSDGMDDVAAPARRALLRSLRGSATAPARPDDAPMPPLSNGLPIEPIARFRAASALTRIADRFDGPVASSSFYPSLDVDERCCNHQVCVAVCPTGALAAGSDVTTVSLTFDPVRCIACGACVRHCPEQAVALAPAGPPPASPDRRRVLRRHPLRACDGCGRPFAEAGSETLCFFCRKTRAFAQAAAFRFAGAVPPPVPISPPHPHAATRDQDPPRA